MAKLIPSNPIVLDRAAPVLVLSNLFGGMLFGDWGKRVRPRFCHPNTAMTPGSVDGWCTPATRSVTLALEGGGSLGAFTWGVLDRLLDVPGLRVDVVSGTSAGAMNGALLVKGLATSGPIAAKQLLGTFWRRVAVASGSLPGPIGAWLQLVGGPSRR